MSDSVFTQNLRSYPKLATPSKRSRNTSFNTTSTPTRNATQTASSYLDPTSSTAVITPVRRSKARPSAVDVSAISASSIMSATPVISPRRQRVTMQQGLPLGTDEVSQSFERPLANSHRSGVVQASGGRHSAILNSKHRATTRLSATNGPDEDMFLYGQHGSVVGENTASPSRTRANGAVPKGVKAAGSFVYHPAPSVLALEDQLCSELRALGEHTHRVKVLSHAIPRNNPTPIYSAAAVPLSSSDMIPSAQHRAVTTVKPMTTPVETIILATPPATTQHDRPEVEAPRHSHEEEEMAVGTRTHGEPPSSTASAHHPLLGGQEGDPYSVPHHQPQIESKRVSPPRPERRHEVAHPPDITANESVVLMASMGQFVGDGRGSSRASSRERIDDGAAQSTSNANAKRHTVIYSPKQASSADERMAGSSINSIARDLRAHEEEVRALQRELAEESSNGNNVAIEEVRLALEKELQKCKGREAELLASLRTLNPAAGA